MISLIINQAKTNEKIATSRNLKGMYKRYIREGAGGHRAGEEDKLHRNCCRSRARKSMPQSQVRPGRS